MTLAYLALFGLGSASGVAYSEHVGIVRAGRVVVWVRHAQALAGERK